jgi:hypothetical protein
VLIPHFLFAHLLADYILQTNWVATGKSRFEWHHINTWNGLLLHGLIVLVISLAVIPNYLETLWPYVTLLALAHTFQDALKVTISRRIETHPFVPYALDQMAHVLAIVILQNIITSADLITSPPPRSEVNLMILGASLVAVTRFYEVSWWANWLYMLPYMNHWRKWGYVERVLMYLLSLVDYWWLAPLAVLPRLYVAWKRGQPVWNQKRGWAEVLLGIVFSVILGSAL